MAMYPSKLKKKTDTLIYGASWDGSSTTTWTRTDDAVNLPNPNPYYLNMSGNPSSPFDDIMPWAGMVRVSDTNAGELVAIPKFYFKLDYANATEPKGLKIQISMTKHSGFICSPAHMDRGDGLGERSVVYVGRYHCANDYKSKTGVTPHTGLNRSVWRTNISGLGTGIYQWDYATVLTIWLLYLVEFATWNSQSAIGYGCSDNNAMQATGLTDSMPYHTGTTKSSRSTYGHIQYRNIEDLWANVFDWVDGIRFSDSDVYIFLNPSTFDDTAGGTLVGTRTMTYSDIVIESMAISSVTDYEWFMFPQSDKYSIDMDTYICDQYAQTSTGIMMNTGGNAGNDTSRGLFYIRTTGTLASQPSDIGSRLMKL